LKQKWALAALALAQFVMVLDQAVMNVSISQLVEDFDTSVTTIQGVITLYSLVMAMFIITGAKVGDIIGRRRAFIVGLVIYAVGSGLTAVAQSVPVLTLGWSVLEGIGAALVLPAMAALIAGNFEGRERVTAYAIMGGVAGAGIAVGPIVGGWATTMLTWRVVFVGEVILVLGILALVRYVADAPREGRKPKLDVVGAVLSSAGLGLIVLGILQSSTWGLIEPKDSPVEPLGFSLTVFVIGAGVASLAAFVRWQRHRESSGQDPLVHLDLLQIGMLRSGLTSLLSQNLILMGIFFVVPLYLQIVLGLDALETGMRMLPVSITMFIFSALGARLSLRFSVRSLVRTGLVIAALAVLVLLAVIDPELRDLGFAISMALLGVGMGLLASQLGNVVQSSVEASGRSEAGGLQYTSQQLGSSLGVALIGAIVIAGLTSNFIGNVEDDPRIPDEVAAQVSVAVGDGVDFISIDQAAEALEDTSLDTATAADVVEDYASAQLQALRAGLLVAAIIALLSLLFTGRLPSGRPQPPPALAGAGEAVEAVQGASSA
jgi:EmrB/QacA subfamily drug resistance transporter